MNHQNHGNLSLTLRFRVPSGVAWMITLLIALVSVGFPAGAEDFKPAPQRFSQEVAGYFDIRASLSSNTLSVLRTNVSSGDIQLVDALPDGSVWFYAAGHWFIHRPSAPTWSMGGTESASGFVFAGSGDSAVATRFAPSNVVQILRRGVTNYLVLKTEIYAAVPDRLIPLGWPAGFGINQAAADTEGTLWVAAEGGLFRFAGQKWEPVVVRDGLGRRWATEDVRGIAVDSANQIWVATKAGIMRRSPEKWSFFEGKDGLPWNDFTCAAAGANGEVWFGTHWGAIRWDGKEFHYRQGPRWLPSDDVRQMVVDTHGNAWFATAAGVGQIARQSMTLAEKAEFYEQELEHYIKRTPYGYVAEAPLRTPGDKSTAWPEDSDNDGLWTSMYGAGETFAYAATHDPKAKERAAKAFEALRFLQKVTQGGTPAPDKGFIARTIRPIDWPNPNSETVPNEAEELRHDLLFKEPRPRWPKSADGKWYWKSDTSSDELDGHYFFYPLYFDFCAETDAEKDRVREVVRDLTDHIIAHGFTLTDHDGKPTRWGVFSPQSLNHDRRWWAERGLNSLSMLNYLTIAAHVTGDAKYLKAAHDLIDREGYMQNIFYPKVQSGPSTGNQSDDEMAFMNYYNLLRYTEDPLLRNAALMSYNAYWEMEVPEMNPFFNFAYAAHATGQTYTNTWGRQPANPIGTWHADSMATLYGFPLDRREWAAHNSHRLDVVHVAGEYSHEPYLHTDTGDGRRVNGRVVPIENRHFNHWNCNPWHLDYGGNGGQLASGTVFLLPYYMGLYHGYIEKP